MSFLDFKWFASSDIMKKNADLLNMPIDGGKIPLKFVGGDTVCTGYDRVVIGQRGPYVEVSPSQMLLRKLYIPKNQLYRLSDPKVYYIEFRTNDEANALVYYQMRNVAYADYKIGFYYISPDNLLYTIDNTTKLCMKKSVIHVLPNEFFETV